MTIDVKGKLWTKDEETTRLSVEIYRGFVCWTAALLRPRPPFPNRPHTGTSDVLQDRQSEFTFAIWRKEGECGGEGEDEKDEEDGEDGSYTDGEGDEEDVEHGEDDEDGDGGYKDEEGDEEDEE